ncbi:MAG: 4Fe-4S binding protein, partial [Anaerococcus obesiensis]
MELDKIRSKTIAKFRWLIQILASLMTNIHLPNFFKGVIYRGN